MNVRYRWSSLVVESRIELPELPRARSARVDVRFDSRVVVARRPAARWSHRWRLPDGTSWLSIGWIGGERLLRFGRLADFIVSSDGRSVRCEASAGTAPDTIRHLLLDQVLPAVAGGERRFAIHASAVAIDGAAVAFLGRAGRGKSTLAAAFGLRGAPIVTDDCLMITWSAARVVAIPTYPSIRLWPAAVARLGARVSSTERVAQYSPKLRVGRDNAAGLRFHERPLPVARLYLLEQLRRTGSPRIVALSRRDSYIELMKFRFRLDPRDRASLHRECDQLVRVAAAVPVARLHMPRGFDALADVRKAVYADMRTMAGR
jgi:hypothetical protein